MCEALLQSIGALYQKATRHWSLVPQCFINGRIGSFRQSITMLGRKQSIVGEHSMVTNDMLEEVTLLASMNFPGWHRGR